MLSLGPLSNLDAQLRAEIKRLHQRLGTAMIYVTHDQIEADRIAVMKDHVFQQIGSPAMNFVPGRIVQEGGGLVFEPDALHLSLASQPSMRKPEHTMPVELGIRSERMIAAPDGANDVAVEMTEPMGSDLLAWTRLDARSLSIRLPAETKADHRRPAARPVARTATESVRGRHRCAPVMETNPCK